MNKIGKVADVTELMKLEEGNRFFFFFWGVEG